MRMKRRSNRGDSDRETRPSADQAVCYRPIEALRVSQAQGGLSGLATVAEGIPHDDVSAAARRIRARNGGSSPLRHQCQEPDAHEHGMPREERPIV